MIAAALAPDLDGLGIVMEMATRNSTEPLFWWSVCDLLGSRGPDGYQWPIPYLWPFSDVASLVVPFQWELNAWPNVAISLVLLAHLFWLAWKRGTSPLELVSARANTAFVHALRMRFQVG